MEKAAASASISEAAQEVYLLLLLCVEAVVVSSNRPTVVVAVNNEVESKSQRFCERCTQTYRADFFASFGGAFTRARLLHMATRLPTSWWCIGGELHAAKLTAAVQIEERALVYRNL